MIVEFVREKGILVAKAGEETFDLEPYILQEFNEGEKAEVQVPDAYSLGEVLYNYASDLEYREYKEMVKELIREHLRWSNSLECKPSSDKNKRIGWLFDWHMNLRHFQSGSVSQEVYEDEKADFERILEEACKGADEWWEEHVESFLEA